MELDVIADIARTTPSKIVLVVMDGLGGLPHPETGKTELETAHTPTMDRLASEGICGLLDPVAPGITPGSAPGHLALFGYDPLRFTVGRGILEALGIDFDLKEGDVAARGNLCTVDREGTITDRRAGRIATERCTEMCRLLDGMEIEGTTVLVTAVKEHRLAAVFRGEGLSGALTGSDPQQEGLAPRKVAALDAASRRTAYIANEFLARAATILADHHPTNMVLLRGFAQYPKLPPMGQVYKLKAAAIAAYPMYRGLAKVVGMEVLDTGPGIEDEVATLVESYDGYDFFFLHVKETDSAGEDGDFERKVRVIEEVDRHLPGIVALEPDVMVITADHSTPAAMASHSWHPVPCLLRSRLCRRDQVTQFSEAACRAGGLGTLPATSLMPLAMANAGKLDKYGA